MLRDRRSRISLTVVCFLIGLLVVMQLRTQNRLAKTPQAASNAEQVVIIANLVEANSQMAREVNQIEAKLQEYQQASGRTDVEVLVQDLNRLKIINGLVEASGPGVEVTIGSAVGITDMQDLVNELRNAGAEGIALNGRRLVFRSVVASDAEGLRLDGVVLKPPYELRAIGQPETLERALERKGGLLQLLRYNHPDWSITVRAQRSVSLPLYEGRYALSNAQVAKP